MSVGQSFCDIFKGGKVEAPAIRTGQVLRYEKFECDHEIRDANEKVLKRRFPFA